MHAHVRSNTIPFALALLGACAGSTALMDGEPGGGGSVVQSPGGMSGSGYKPRAVGEGAVAVQVAATRCGGGACAASSESARASFDAGDYAAAFEAWKCAGSSEAAFGAGLSKLLSAFESDGADAMFAAVGMPPFEARSLLGPDSYLSRRGARFQGEGMLTLSGEIAGTFALDAVLAGLPEEGLEASGSDGSRQLGLEVWNDGSGFPAVGSYPVVIDCATGVVRYSGPSLSLSPPPPEDGGGELDCSQAFSLPQDGTPCSPDGGAFVVHAAGQQPGAPVQYELSNLAFRCERYDDQTGETIGAPFVIRASGHVSGTVSDEVVVSDLHPLYSGIDNSAVRPDVRFDAFAEHGAAVADELATAACLLDLAAVDADVAFTLPGTSFGGEDLGLRAGDAKILAAAAAVGGTLLKLGRAYAFDADLRSVVCLLGGNDDEAACSPLSSVVDAVNASVAKVTVNREALQAAHYLAELALIQLDEGIDVLDERSAFRRTARGTAGLAYAQAWARAGRASLAEGPTALPEVMPAALVDLRALFSMPRDPSSIQVPLVTYAEECDAIECFSDLDFQSAFLSELLPGTTIDWQGAGYEVAPAQSEAFETAMRDVVDGFRQRHFLVFE